MALKTPFTTQIARGGYSAIIFKEGDLYVAETDAGTVIEENTNASVVIQAAIDALPASKGKIHFSSGTFYISAPIIVASAGITLEGEGRFEPVIGTGGTQLRATSGIAIIQLTFTTDDFSIIKDMSIYGFSTAGTENVGINVGEADDVLIEKVYVSHCYYGIKVTGQATNFQIVSSWLEKNRIGLKADAQGGAISGRLLNNVFGPNDDNAVELYNFTNSAHHSFLCSMNTFIGTTQSAFWARDVRNVILSNNWIDTRANKFGIHIRQNTGLSNHWIISDNIGYGGSVGESFLYIEEGDYIIVSDNNIQDFVGTPIDVVTGQNLHGRIYDKHSDLFMDVLAASATAVHAAITGTGAEQEITTAITNPDVPRNISIMNSANSTGNVKIDGVDAKGNIVSDTISIITGGIAYGIIAFATVTKITIPAGVVSPDTIAVGISDKLGLSNIIYASGDVYKAKVNNADDPTIGTVSISNDTVDCATINANDDITIWYRSNLNAIS